ncbi:MAG: hypothetical protein GW900_05715, partial [Gammaproteobacteria bacterium]|nr:hypothetical protein [Gammaproteobacteria bacterium]
MEVSIRRLRLWLARAQAGELGEQPVLAANRERSDGIGRQCRAGPIGKRSSVLAGMRPKSRGDLRLAWRKQPDHYLEIDELLLHPLDLPIALERLLQPRGPIHGRDKGTFQDLRYFLAAGLVVQEYQQGRGIQNQVTHAFFSASSAATARLSAISSLASWTSPGNMAESIAQALLQRLAAFQHQALIDDPRHLTGTGLQIQRFAQRDWNHHAPLRAATCTSFSLTAVTILACLDFDSAAQIRKAAKYRVVLAPAANQTRCISIGRC